MSVERKIDVDHQPPVAENANKRLLKTPNTQKYRDEHNDEEVDTKQLNVITFV